MVAGAGVVAAGEGVTVVVWGVGRNGGGGGVVGGG